MTCPIKRRINFNFATILSSFFFPVCSCLTKALFYLYTVLMTDLPNIYDCFFLTVLSSFLSAPRSYPSLKPLFLSLPPYVQSVKLTPRPVEACLLPILKMDCISSLLHIYIYIYILAADEQAQPYYFILFLCLFPYLGRKRVNCAHELFSLHI